jgi:hypothetical protein
MGSTARRRGVYGGEYAPTGLSLFAWWKKNEKRGFRNRAVAPRELGHPSPSVLAPFIGEGCLGYELLRGVHDGRTICEPLPPRSDRWNFTCATRSWSVAAH